MCMLMSLFISSDCWLYICFFNGLRSSSKNRFMTSRFRTIRSWWKWKVWRWWSWRLRMSWLLISHSFHRLRSFCDSSLRSILFEWGWILRFIFLVGVSANSSFLICCWPNNLLLSLLISFFYLLKLHLINLTIALDYLSFLNSSG